MSKKLLLLLALTLLTSAKLLSQSDVQAFLQKEKMVSHSATLANYQNKDGKYFLTYQDGNSQQKFILQTDSQDKLHIVFMETFTSYSVSLQANTPQIEYQPITPFIMINGQVQGMGRREGRRGCMKMMREKIQKKLFQKIPELEGGNVVQIEKIGRQKGKGVEFMFVIEKDNSVFTVDAFYRPRRDELNIVSIEEEQKEKPLRNGLELISSFFKQIMRPQKTLIVGSEGEKERMPLLGSEGEKERMPLLGSEGEKERMPLLGSEGEKERMPLLGSEGEKERFTVDESEEEDEDVEIVEDDGLILERGEMVGQDEKIETSFGQGEDEQIQDLKPELKDERRL